MTFRGHSTRKPDSTRVKKKKTKKKKKKETKKEIVAVQTMSFLECDSLQTGLRKHEVQGRVNIT